MIKRFRHAGLERLYRYGDHSGVPSQLVTKIRYALAMLNTSSSPQGMNLPGFRLHQLKGNLRGTWAVSVSGNWRITFQFDGADAVKIDLVDYH